MSDNACTMDGPRDILYSLVRDAADAAAVSWLDACVAELEASDEPRECLLRFFPAARRRLGAGRLTTAGQVIATADGTLRLDAWSPGDAGRAILLLDAIRHGGGADIVTAVYRAGDETERSSVTRALSLLDLGAALKPLALETGRVNSKTLYAALALHNPFPSAQYSEHEFNQLVLKSLFIGLPVAAIVGLAGRANERLSRMCEDYFDERTAAGRDVPPDIWLALAPHASERGLKLLNEHRDYANAEHRRHAARALANRDAGK